MKSFKSIVLWMAALLAIGAALICFEGDMLWKIQQYNLFLSSPLFFKQMMVVLRRNAVLYWRILHPVFLPSLAGSPAVKLLVAIVVMAYQTHVLHS